MRNSFYKEIIMKYLNTEHAEEKVIIKKIINQTLFVMIHVYIFLQFQFISRRELHT